MDEIKNLTNPSMALFTWLSSSEQKEAKAELARQPLPNIRNDIKFKWDDVNYSRASLKHINKSKSVKNRSKISKTF